MLSGSILSGDIVEVLDKIANNRGEMRASITLELLTSVGIIVMSSLLYVVLRDQNSGAALAALGLWMAEAVMLAPPVLVATLLLVWDRSNNPGIAFYAPYVPFELVMGLWLLMKGADVPPPHRANGATDRQGQDPSGVEVEAEGDCAARLRLG